MDTEENRVTKDSVLLSIIHRIAIRIRTIEVSIIQGIILGPGIIT